MDNINKLLMDRRKDLVYYEKYLENLKLELLALGTIPNTNDNEIIKAEIELINNKIEVMKNEIYIGKMIITGFETLKRNDKEVYNDDNDLDEEHLGLEREDK